MTFRLKYNISDNLEAYNRFAEDNKHIVQLSFERSGRVWLSGLMDKLLQDKTNIHTFNLERDNYGHFYRSCYLHTHLHDELKFFDTAKYIFLIRDPRDSFRSWMRLVICEGDYDENLWTDKDVLYEMCNGWVKYFTSGVLEQDTLLVRYEDLCLYPKLTICRILDHIVRIELAEEINAILSTWFDVPETDYYQHHCMKWKRAFTSGQAEYIFNLIGDTMLQYGYTKDGSCESYLET